MQELDESRFRKKCCSVTVIRFAEFDDPGVANGST